MRRRQLPAPTTVNNRGELVRVASRRGKHRRSWKAVALRRAGAPVLATVLAGGMFLAGVADAMAATAAIKNPVAPKSAPAVIESYSPYLPQTSCDPVVKPGTKALRAMLLATYGGRDLGITRACDIGGLSEHKEGRAFDWGLRASVPAEKAIAKQFLTFLTANSGRNARRLGVMYLIWNGRIWGAYRASEGWRAYSGGEAHADHIHISLSWNGAMKHTSWWTGRKGAVDYGPCVKIEGELAPRYAGARATPCPAPVPLLSLTGTPLLKYDSEGVYVKQLQKLLKVSPVSGWFGPLTESALRDFQSSHDLSVTGTTTVATWGALRNPAGATPPPASSGQASVAPKYLARLLHTVKRGQSLSSIAAYWRSSVTSIKAANHLHSNTIRVGQVLSVPVRSSLTKYLHRTLRRGDHGAPVKALQKAMRMKKRYRTGYFGSITKRRVNHVRRDAGWKLSGVAGKRVWIRLGA